MRHSFGTLPGVPVAPQTAAALLEGLRRFGLDGGRLGVPEVRDDLDLATLWWRAIARTGRRTLPFEVGLALPLGAMGLVDYLAASSATVGAALTVVQQVFPTVAPGVQLVLERAPSGLRRVTLVNQPPYPGSVESDSVTTAILLGRLRALSSRPFEPAALELTEPPPGPAGRAEWARLTLVPRLRFGARRASLHVHATDWTAPIRSADHRLLATLRRLLTPPQRSVDALAVAVRALASERLPALLELPQAALALGLSRRTLQRTLAARGTSLSTLVDEVRRDRAEQLVEAGLSTLGEVANAVGFAEPASFTRAWRRWFGRPPSHRNSPSHFMR